MSEVPLYGVKGERVNVLCVRTLTTLEADASHMLHALPALRLYRGNSPVRNTHLP